MFNQSNKDKNGYIDEFDLYNLMKATWKEVGFDDEPTSLEIKEWMDKVDLNVKGKFSLTEF